MINGLGGGSRRRGWTGHVNLVSVQVINTTMFVRRSYLFIQSDLRFASFARINYGAVTQSQQHSSIKTNTA